VRGEVKFDVVGRGYRGEENEYSKCNSWEWFERTHGKVLSRGFTLYG
jgi:hypothetical protein